MAEGRDDAEKAFDRFLAKYQAKYDKAADCLAKDRDALLAFYGMRPTSTAVFSADRADSVRP
jgi:transposase-like protein